MIHVVIGAPCAGKSTYVREHAQDGDVRADFDLIAQALGCATSHGCDGNLKEAAFKARNAVVTWALDHPDAESWVIHSDPAEWQLKAYEDAGAEFIALDTDMQTCLERAESDGRPSETRERIREWFERHSEKKNGVKMHKTKTCAVDIKASDNGAIEGYFSTWTREPDAYGDVVAKGAFVNSFKRINESGGTVPFLWNHDADNLDSYIGTAGDLQEDEHGAFFRATFDATETAQRARELAMDGRLAKFSFAYDVLDQGTVTLDDGREANELRELELYEVSLVMYPANRDTSVTDVKSGRRNSKADEERLREIEERAEQIREIVSGLLADSDNEDEADEIEGGEVDATTEGRETEKAEILELYKSTVKGIYNA